jgi:hypothetical protein
MGRASVTTLHRFAKSVRRLFVALSLFVVIGAVLLVSMLFVERRHEARLSLAQSNGDRIVAALEAFHATSGRYPLSLDELIPAHLPQLPPTGFDHARWTFTPGMGGGYILSLPYQSSGRWRTAERLERRANAPNWTRHVEDSL